METDPVSETLSSLVFRIPEDGQSSKTQSFCVNYYIHYCEVFKGLIHCYAAAEFIFLSLFVGNQNNLTSFTLMRPHFETFNYHITMHKHTKNMVV
jgi:hypothetical protein